MHQPPYLRRVGAPHHRSSRVRLQATSVNADVQLHTPMTHRYDRYMDMLKVAMEGFVLNGVSKLS